ncbi:phage portal protein, partial [Mycobacterium kansasii]
MLDKDYPVNPSPHWFTLNTARSTTAKANGWGKVPFVELKNNDFKTNDLSNIKDKIDAYDIVESESVNQIADVREVLVK